MHLSESRVCVCETDGVYRWHCAPFFFLILFTSLFDLQANIPVVFGTTMSSHTTPNRIEHHKYSLRVNARNSVCAHRLFVGWSEFGINGCNECISSRIYVVNILFMVANGIERDACAHDVPTQSAEPFAQPNQFDWWNRTDSMAFCVVCVCVCNDCMTTFYRTHEMIRATFVNLKLGTFWTYETRT